MFWFELIVTDGIWMEARVFGDASAVQSDNQLSIDYVAFNLIMDELVFPTGERIENMLGGGGPQTAFGMRLWSPNVGLFGSVSADLPEDAIRWLDTAGIDKSGLILRDGNTLSSRQTYSETGERKHDWVSPQSDLARHFSWTLEDLPETYRWARGFHLGVHPDEPVGEFVLKLSQLPGALSLETFKPADHTLSADELAALVTVPEIISCNWHEGRTLTGYDDPKKIVGGILSAGARVVVLRLGVNGCLVAAAKDQTHWHVPAVPNYKRYNLALGAGNAFCGGFLVGWLETHDLRWAGACGSAAASFLVEHPGLPAWHDDLPAIALTRAKGLEALSQSHV